MLQRITTDKCIFSDFNDSFLEHYFLQGMVVSKGICWNFFRGAGDDDTDHSWHCFFRARTRILLPNYWTCCALVALQTGVLSVFQESGKKQLKLVKIRNYEDYLKLTPREKRTPIPGKKLGSIFMVGFFS